MYLSCRVKLLQTLGKKCSYSKLELFWSIVSLRIQSEYGKKRTRITPNTANFHAVKFLAKLRRFRMHSFKETLLLSQFCHLVVIKSIPQQKQSLAE